MAINYRAATISIAVITIIFSIITIINSIHYDKEDFEILLHKYAVQTGNRKLSFRIKDIADFVGVVYKYNIACSVLSIITAALMFAVCGQYMQENKGRRMFLLPYIIANSLIFFATIVLTIMMANKMTGATTVVTTLIGITVAGLLIKALFITLMALYFRFLVRYSGY